MPSTLIAPPVEFESVPRKKWTRDECAQLGAILDLFQSELIDGELIKKMGKNHPHVWTLMLLAKWLESIFPDFTIGKEVPIDVRPEDNPSSDPEPDAVVLTKEIGVNKEIGVKEIGVKDPVTPNLITHNHNPSRIQQVTTLRGSSARGGDIHTPHLSANPPQAPAWRSISTESSFACVGFLAGGPGGSGLNRT